MRKLFIIISLMLLLCGCRTKYIPIESTHIEYRDRLNEVRVTDSVANDRLVYIKGDTVIVSVWRDRWRTRTEHDSIYISKTDTIRIPYPVEKPVEVERKCRWWETILLCGAGIIVVLGLILLLFCYFKRVTKTDRH